MIFIRSAITVTAAACITVGLFASMRFMVGITESKLKKIPPPISLNLTRAIKDTKVQTKRHTPPPKVTVPQAPPSPTIENVETAGPGAIGIMATAAPPPAIDTNFAANLSLTAPSDGGLVPRVRIEPIYPARALQHKIQGWVELVFDVTPTGATERIRVVRAEPKRVFNQAAIQAISRWKYQPQIVDGKPVSSPNQRVVLKFNLNNQRAQI